jgi:hypothetical protein
VDWNKAEQYLKDCEAAYTEIGRAGMIAMICVISPLRDRFNSGERTQELYEEVMEIKL